MLKVKRFCIAQKQKRVADAMIEAWKINVNGSIIWQSKVTVQAISIGKSDGSKSNACYGG